MKEKPEGIEGVSRVDSSIRNPTWDQVGALIHQLDGVLCSEVSIEGPNRYGMTIGGGPARFYVSTIGEDMGPYDLLGPDPSDETERIVLGSQLTELPRRFLSTKNQALRAAEYFFYHGRVDPALNWHLC
jgi:hypothetical protein